MNTEDRDLLRFLWWKGGYLETRPLEYRMKVHVFGAASSPGCANFGLKQTAKDGEDDFGVDSEFLRRTFYVDDGLKSVKTASAATRLIQNSQAMCAKAGIRLQRFISNTKEVLEAIPPEDRAEGLQDLHLKFDKLPIERTLGVIWCIETDCFRFHRPLTRRGVLSTVSSFCRSCCFGWKANSARAVSCWERQIRTVRNVLAALLEESGTYLDDKCFRTLMKEVQSIVNSRPLTVNNMASPDFPEPLTPNNLLTMKVKVLMPSPGVFQREDLY